ncbi:MAG TPA: bL12 family ribosomal protein [Gemmataceae bacterium]|nr:bL12 family ribosomal protein [Gemmataceae bacterium]
MSLLPQAAPGEVIVVVKELCVTYLTQANSPNSVGSTNPHVGFDIYLERFEATRKIPVIKVVRQVTGLGLKEAKELVEAAPRVVREHVEPAEAERIKAELEAAGATVSLR